MIARRSRIIRRLCEAISSLLSRKSEKGDDANVCWQGTDLEQELGDLLKVGLLEAGLDEGGAGGERERGLRDVLVRIGEDALAEFRALYPSVDLRLETLDKDVDIAAEATSLAIRRGHGEWPGYASARLTPERITAVASPAFLGSHGPVRDLRHVLSWPLIHLDEPHRYRPSWREFFEYFGISFHDRGDGLRLNDYALVLQAAMAGEGVAIGWEHICERPIAQGLLASVGTWTYSSDAAFYLVWSEGIPLTPQAELVRQWILGQKMRAP